MSISEVAIRRPVLAWMGMAALIIFGGICFQRLGVSQLPDVDFPVVTVALNYEGAAPEVMEMDVVDPIEDAMMSVQGVTSVTSSSRNSSATVTVEFDLDRNIDLALQDVQAKIAQVQRRLPREMDPPVISKTNPDDQPIMWLAATSDKLTMREMMLYARDQLKDKFSTLPGVGEVFMGGYVEPNLRIWVTDKGLSKYDLAVNDIISTITNEHTEPPAGRIETGSKEYNVRTLGEAESVPEFENIIINQRGGMPNFVPIRLKQVARVEEGLADVRRLSRKNGEQAVGMGIRKQRGSNAVAVAKAVRKKLAEVNKSLPPGIKIDTVFDSTRFIEDSVHELNFTLVLSALLTAIVCWLFLGSWSSTLNVLLAIPTSIVGTFMVLMAAGFTLNTFTLLALSLAIGIVVDDAIMVLENIIRHKEHGLEKTEAALKGSKEITFAAMAATISIIAIFLPVAFMKGVIGKFFYQFGVTMTAAVLLSLLEALTLTPMRCAQFVEGGGERSTRIGRGVEAAIDWITRAYKKSLGWSLKNRFLVLGAALLFFVVSFGVIKGLNKEMLPKEDQSRFMVRIQTPVGSSLAYTDTKFKEVEKYLGSRPEIERYFIAVGGFGGGEVNTGIAFVTLTDPRKRMTQHTLMDLCRKELSKIPDVKVTVQDLSMRGFTASRGFPVEFTVRGPDWDTLGKSSQALMAALEKQGLLTDVDSDYQVGMPEIQVKPDREKASARGVSVSAIGQTINAMIGGVLVGRYPSGGHRYDIRLRLEDSTDDRLSRIRSLYVRNNRGELIPLSELVKIEEKPSLQAIARKDRSRAVTVFANVKTGKSQEAALDQVEKLGRELLPPGYQVVLSGSSQTFKESFQSLIFALVLGLIVAYMVLASQFNSYIDPVIVLLALPFSISGAFLTLFVTGQSLNLYSMIGLILLMGIVKKNSILLVDFTNQVRDGGVKAIPNALLEACPIRLRPILMTSLATVVGAVPAALSLGPGAEARVPMAIAVIGGVILSTFLTLYVVPCAYTLLSSKHRKKIVV